MRQEVDGLHFFPAMLLDGSEMGTMHSRKTYGLKGEWRPIDGCAGTFGPVCAMEYEEIITSTKAMIRRLGRNWGRLHRAVYVVAVLGVIHYGMAVKKDLTDPITWAIVLTVLLGWRLAQWNRRRATATSRPA